MVNASLFDIPYVQLHTQIDDEYTELMPIIEHTLRHRQHVGDACIDELESSVAELAGTKYAVALNSGTDALMFGMLGAGITRGDEVITPPNSFVASTSSIVHIGGKPVFADVLPDQNIDPAAIEAAITPRTKAIMPVHLSGRMCRMDEIARIADRHNLLIIEDSAQSIGSHYLNRPAGSWGMVGCFSMHPLKNLNACGDGGFLTTNVTEIAQRVRRLRSHGMSNRDTVDEWGFVSRMDSLQAAILTFRLRRLADVITRRRANAAYYQQHLRHDSIFIPPCRPEEFNTFHTFVVQVKNRDALRAHLAARGIETAIHYPVPIHLQPAAAKLGHGLGAFPVTERQAAHILTLPVNQYLTHPEQDRIIREVHDFYAK